MDDDRSSQVAVKCGPALNSPLVKRWKARLDLAFQLAKGRSYLAKNLHKGPLVMQKTLHPEGEAVCHGVVIHPPGGVAGGDELSLHVDVGVGAHALLTMPGAGKWYKSNGQTAKQHLQFNVQSAAKLEWLPQENILFDGAQVEFSADVRLAGDAQYAAWEVTCLGRQAQGERWNTGGMLQKLQIRREDKLIWNECMALSPNSRILHSIVGLKGNVVSAGFVVAAGEIPAEILQACRAVKPQQDLDNDAHYGVTALPEVFAARYVGQSSQCAREYFESLWRLMRPWYAEREAIRPRVWNT